jgi:hypothetical protein
VGITITVRTRIFTPDWTQRASEMVLDIQLDALIAIDLLWLRLNPKTPRMRASGVRYYHEGIKDEWFSVDAALHDHVADCKGLAAWDVAELRASGEDPGAHTTKRFVEVVDPTVGKLLLYHVLTERSDGRLIDPSRELGMGGSEPDGYMPVPGVAWGIANALTHTIGASQLGNTEADAALEELWQREQAGDKRAKYLNSVVRMIINQGYDARRSRFVRRADGSFEWDYPDANGNPNGLESRGGNGGRI